VPSSQVSLLVCLLELNGELLQFECGREDRNVLTGVCIGT
jgi:hypothetical protein